MILYNVKCLHLTMIQISINIGKNLVRSVDLRIRSKFFSDQEAFTLPS